MAVVQVGPFTRKHRSRFSQCKDTAQASASLQDRQIRVSGNKRDELQEVIAFLRAKDFGVSLSFKNFRD